MSIRFWSCVCLAIPLSLSAQNYRIDTVAGFGTFGGDGGAATAALLTPGAVAVDANGVVYVSDPGNFRIRRIDNAGTITTLIGRGYGTFRGDYGPAALAGMSTANSLALDRSGNLYFTDDSNQRIREITTSGLVFTVAGNGNCGTASAGVKATQAPLCDVESVAVDGQGDPFAVVAGLRAGDGADDPRRESSTQRIRKLTKVSGPIPARRRSVL